MKNKLLAIAAILLFAGQASALNVSGNNLVLFYPNASALGEQISASCFDSGNHTQYGLAAAWYAVGDVGSQIELGSGKTFARGIAFSAETDYFRFDPAVNYTQVVQCTSADGRSLNATAPLYVFSPGQVNWLTNALFLFAKAPGILITAFFLGLVLTFAFFLTAIPLWLKSLKDQF